MTDVSIFAFVADGHIDDVRSIAPADVPGLNATAVDGQWVPVASLQGHPDVIYFLSGNVSERFNTSPDVSRMEVRP